VYLRESKYKSNHNSNNINSNNNNNNNGNELFGGTKHFHLFALRWASVKCHIRDK